MKPVNIDKTNFYNGLQNKIFSIVLEKLEQGEQVLDVGCGDCKLAEYLARERNMKIVGLDIDGKKFTDTLEKFSDNIQTKVICKEGDAENLKDFANESFSAVVSVYSLHEFHNPLRMLQECARVLTKEGKIIVVDFLPNTLAEELWSEQYLKAQEMKKLIRKAGFKIIQQELISQEGPALTIGCKRGK